MDIVNIESMKKSKYISRLFTVKMSPNNWKTIDMVTEPCTGYVIFEMYKNGELYASSPDLQELIDLFNIEE